MKKGTKEDMKAAQLKSAEKFLRAIYHDPSDYDYEQADVSEIGIGTKYETKWFQPGDYAKMAEHAISINNDAYYHVCSHNAKQAESMAKESKGDAFRGKFRGRIATATNMHMLFLDLDLAEAGKDNGKNYPDKDSALEIMRQLELPPSMIVSSGTGMHVYWLLVEPEAVDSELFRKWTEFLRLKFNGYELDAVFDAARLLRVPGTWNGKTGEKPVVLHYLDDERRYNVSDFDKYVECIPDKAQYKSFSGTGKKNVVLDPKRKPAQHRLKEIIRDKSFSSVFFKTFEYKNDPSHSSTDWALTKIALKFGWEDQEIIDLLIYCRQCHDEELHLQNTHKYLRTIERAKQYS